MEIILESKIDSDLQIAELFCLKEGIEIEFTYEIEDDILDVISERTQSHPSMYFASKAMLKERLKNGAYLLRKDGEVCGHIFVHEHKINKFSVFERASLWIDMKYGSHNLGLMLMNLLTQKFSKQFLISIAREPRVHHNNELLGMKRVRLSDLSPILVETLERLGKLRDENYKYYVNPYFESKLNQINKILLNRKNDN